MQLIESGLLISNHIKEALQETHNRLLQDSQQNNWSYDGWFNILDCLLNLNKYQLFKDAYDCIENVWQSYLS
jgi:hypothetical protein